MDDSKEAVNDFQNYVNPQKDNFVSFKSKRK